MKSEDSNNCQIFKQIGQKTPEILHFWFTNVLQEFVCDIIINSGQRLKICKTVMPILLKFLILDLHILRTIWCIEVSDDSFLSQFSFFFFNLSLSFFDQSFPLIRKDSHIDFFMQSILSKNN